MSRRSNRDLNLGGICVAMQKARLTLRRVREERREAVRQFVGYHWSEEGARQQVPINLVSLYTRVLASKLIAKNPRVNLSTFKRENKPVVSAMQDWVNEAIQKMHLAQTLQRVAVDALYSVGVSKVALAAPAESAKVAWNLKAGAPFCERVDLDDFVFDIHARSFEEAGYIGHRFRAPLDVVRESKLYGSARKDLTSMEDPFFNLEGDERISMLGRGYYSNEEDYEDFIDLWEVYLPRHRVIVTIAHDYVVNSSGQRAGQYGARALREQSWIGPDDGPYHILGLGVVPGNAMPKAPIQDLIDLHMAANRVYRKLIRQADRQKEILAVAGGAAEDGTRAVECQDGEAIRMDHPADSVLRNFGGPNQANFGMFADLVNRFSWLAGNLDIMGGLSPQSKTASQDQMLNANSSAGVADMQEQVVSYTEKVTKALCWYWHHDPFRVMRSTFSLPGMPEIQLERQVTPQDRHLIPFDQLGIRVDPYSLQYKTPEARLATLNQIVTQILTPMMALLQQQGIRLDINAYLRKVGQYTDSPDLEEIITLQEMPTQESPGGAEQQQPGKPGQTTRNYVRESVPQRTRQGNDANLASSLMGVNPGGGSEQAQANGKAG